MAEALTLLMIYNLLFFWQAWTKPFSLATSELLSTYFPTWIWQGREWSKWRIPKYDPYYWINAHAHPVISSYYIPQLLCSFWPTKSLNSKFRVLVLYLIMHYIVSSIGWFSLINTWSSSSIALLGAITLTYASYNIKQQPCFIYTIAWFPWLLLGIATHSILLSSISFGMILLAGYYPIGIQATLIALGASIWWDTPLTWVLIGTLIGLPQLIPFFKYLPKTIRTNKHDEIGKVKLSHLWTLIFPGLNKPHNVGFWETSCYVGIVPLMLIAYSIALSPNSISQVWILGVASYILAMGAFSQYLPRIPARWLWSFQFSLGWLAVSSIHHLSLDGAWVWSLLIIQGFDLWWHNRGILPSKPYCELPNRPSFAFNTRLTRYLEGCQDRVSGLPFPLFTGHINRLKTLGYCGGMQLKLMAKWRNDTNPNGSGEHDYFRSNYDGEQLDRARVRYAYSTAPIPWEPTSLKRLYRNPRIG